MSAKISIPRVKPTRRTRTFLAKWGGIIVAAILVAAIAGFGSTYLYAAGRVNGTLAWVTQNINLSQMGAAGTLEDPPRAIYRVILQVDNPTADSAEVTVSDLFVTLDELNLEMEKLGDWTKTVPPAGTVRFEGNIIIDTILITILTERGAVDLFITGNIDANAAYGMVNKSAQRPIRIVTTAEFGVDTQSTP
jgi:hypothetical protein